MKNLLFIIGAALVILFYKDIPQLLNPFDPPPQLEQQRVGNGIKVHQFSTLFKQNKPFSDLAKKGSYTIVEGYLDSCPICKRLEADFPRFLEARNDVVIQRVHFPENGMQFEVSGTTQAEVDRQVAEYNQKMKDYGMCGTPFIEIYNENKELIVGDTCSKRPATQYLQQWIAADI